MKSKYVNKVFQITDLVKCIGALKHQFEVASDIQKLNNTYNFQSLIFHLFHNVFDSGIIIKQNDNRLAIRICKHKNPTITITFETFEKYKRQPYYFDTLFLDMTDTPIQNNKSNYQIIF